MASSPPPPWVTDHPTLHRGQGRTMTASLESGHGPSGGFGWRPVRSLVQPGHPSSWQ